MKFTKPAFQAAGRKGHSRDILSEWISIPVSTRVVCTLVSLCETFSPETPVGFAHNRKDICIALGEDCVLV